MPEKKKRGRPPKVKVEDNPKILSDTSADSLKMEQKITVQEVQRSLTGLFSQAFGNGFGTTFGSATDLNLYNPFLQNTRLKMLNSYPATYSPEEISGALQSPQSNEQKLRQASWSLSSSQYLYYKILREAADVPMFLHWICPPSLTQEEYKSSIFLKEEEFVDEWLDKFDLQNTLKKVAFEIKREGKATYLFRQCLSEENGQKKVGYVAWQKLPPDYTKLTAIGERGYIASFNMLLFLNPIFSPSQFPDYIQKIWEDLINKQVISYDSKKENYNVNFNKLRTYEYKDKNSGNPAVKGIVELVNQSYMYWVQLPQDLCFTFASDTSHAWVAPDTMGLFTALQELTDYSTLAGLVASSPLTAVLTGQAETISNPSAGQDQTIISPSMIATFQNAFNAMVSGNIQGFFGPFKDMKLHSLPNVPNASDIKTKAVQNFISSAGEGGIITATDKPSVAMIKGAQLLTASQYEFVTLQFESIINALMAKWLDLKYTWKIHLWGDIFTYNDTVGRLKEMVSTGASFLLPQLASAYKISMRELKGINNYIAASDVYSSMMSWTGNKNTNSVGKSVGRPSVDDNSIQNDNTAASKEAGTNTGDMRNYSFVHGHCLLCNAEIEENEYICEECKIKYEVEDNN